MNQIYFVAGFDLGNPLATSQRVMAWVESLSEQGHIVEVITPPPSQTPRTEGASQNVRFKFAGKRIGLSKNSFVSLFVRSIVLLHVARAESRGSRGFIQLEGASLGGMASLMGMRGYVLDLMDLDFGRRVFSNSILQATYEIVFSFLQRRGVKTAAKVIAVSESMRRFLISSWRIPAHKVLVIPNGYSQVQLDIGNRSSETLGKVSYAGYLGEYIDIDSIIQTAEEIEPLGGVLHIVGDGPAKSGLIALAQRKEIRNILFSDIIPLDQASTVSAESQVVILPLRETFHTRTCSPTKLVQYSVMGKAIVCTAVSDNAMALKRKEAALVVAPGNPREFAQAVRKLLIDDDLRRSLGVRSRSVFRTYNWKNLSSQLAKLYTK